MEATGRSLRAGGVRPYGPAALVRRGIYPAALAWPSSFWRWRSSSVHTIRADVEAMLAEQAVALTAARAANQAAK